MKNFKKALSLCMVIFLLLSSFAFSSSAKTVYDKYGFWYPASDRTYAHIGVSLNDLKYEIVNDSQFVYIIRNGEAIILNVRTNFIGPDKTTFVFPTYLGGYPVTTIGDIENPVFVFDYYQFPNDIEPENIIEYAEVDPGLRYVSKIIIPEGYKYIGASAFCLVGPNMTFYLPDSLELIGVTPFEGDAVIDFAPWPFVILGIKPATDTPYYSYGNRDYTLDVTGSPSKIQVVRDNGGTTTIDRRRAKVTSNGETETWVVNMRVEAGTHNIRAKYGNKWDERLTPFTVTYDTPPTPKAYSFDLGYENGLGTFEVVTDPQIIKVQFLLDNGCTLTYSQGNSYVAEDGMRHWVITRKIPANTNYTLKTKLGYTWTTTDLTVTS